MTLRRVFSFGLFLEHTIADMFVACGLHLDVRSLLSDVCQARREVRVLSNLAEAARRRGSWERVIAVDGHRRHWRRHISAGGENDGRGRVDKEADSNDREGGAC